MNEINGVKVELLQALTTILEVKSLTESARRLGVTQSAVSHSLRKLRQQLGDELVIRDGNRLVLTSKAERLYPELKRWFGDLEEILRGEEFDPKASTEVFYISTSDIVEQMYMPLIVAALKKEAPKISIRMVRWNPDLLPMQLTNSQVDMAIGVRNLNVANLMQKVLYKETFVSAARSKHPIFKTKLQLEDFLTYPHTMTSSGDRIKGVVDTALEKLNRERVLTHTVSNFSSAPFVLENSDCILTAPRRFLNQLEQRHKVKTFEPPLDLPSFELKLLWLRKHQQTASSKWLREFLYEVFSAYSSNT